MFTRFRFQPQNLKEKFGSLVWVRQVNFDEKDFSLTTVVNTISQVSWLSEAIKLAEALF